MVFKKSYKELLKEKKVFVVDDNSSIRELISVIFNTSGSEVLEADTAAGGIKLARQEVPSIIIMDINMPEMNGIEAVRIINASPEMRGIPILLISACHVDLNALRAEMDISVDYLSKPFDTTQILEKAVRMLTVQDS